MNEEIETLKDVARRLDASGIPYMVTGSFAMTLHAIPRMTRDIDIVITVPEDGLRKLLTAFSQGYYISEAAVREALQAERMFNVINNETIVKVDLIVKRNLPASDAAFARRQKIMIDGIPISVSSKEDLILAKLAWYSQTGSEMQEKDLRHLLATGCDLDYVRDQIDEPKQRKALEHILGNG